MLNYKEKIIKLPDRGECSLHSVLKGFSWCMCLTSILFLLTGILFLITGDQNIFFMRDNLSVTNR